MQTVSIFAGNPAVELKNNEVCVDPQLRAFSVALKYAAECGERVRMILMGIDHLGDFGPQFFDNKAEVKNDTPLTLSMLRPEIRKHFEKVCVAYGIPLERISIITEEEARNYVLRSVSADDRRLIRSKIDEQGEDVYIPNCRAITAAIIARLASSGAQNMRAVWQYDPKRVRPQVIREGIEYAYEIFGVTTPLKNTMVYGDQRVVDEEFGC